MLANSEIIVTLDSTQIRFRPTLRAAMRLERRFNGFQKILKDLRDQNITVISAVIEECADKPDSLIEFLIYDSRHSLAVKIGAVIDPLMILTLHLAGIDDKAPDAKKAAGEAIEYPEYFDRLFRIATGWLGWTPAEAWQSTPAEIMAAYKGRVEMLRAILGEPEEKSRTMTPEVLGAFFRTRAKNA